MRSSLKMNKKLYLIFSFLTVLLFGYFYSFSATSIQKCELNIESYFHKTANKGSNVKIDKNRHSPKSVCKIRTKALNDSTFSEDHTIYIISEIAFSYPQQLSFPLKSFFVDNNSHDHFSLRGPPALS